MRRYRLDSGVERHPGVIIGGSPLKVFRVTPAGDALVDRIAEQQPIDDSTLVTALLDAGAIHPAPERADGSGVGVGPSDVTLVLPIRATAGQQLPAWALEPGVIVVDDASPVPVAGATARLDVNRGPGAARNAGVQRITTPLVAFVDADVDLPPGWLDALLPHFGDPRVALVAPRVVTPDEGAPTAAYEHRHSPLDLGPQPAPIRQGTRVSYVPAAAIVCRTDAVRAIGGFDESLRFGEDVDFVWRLDAAGWRCRYEPAAVVHHAPRPSWWAWCRQRITYGQSSAPLARRHPGALAPLRISGWSVTAWAAALVAPPAGVVAGGAVAAGSAAALPPKLPDVPRAAAFRLAWRGNVAAGGQIAQAVRRAWWPLLALAAVRWRPARRALALSAIAARSPLRVADDAAFSIGVWKGVLAERTLGPLLPQFGNWPGKRVPADRAEA